MEWQELKNTKAKIGNEHQQQVWNQAVGKTKRVKAKQLWKKLFRN